MARIRVTLLAMYEILCIPLALVGVPIALLFAKWDDTTSTFTGGAEDNGPPTIRGDLPVWAAWFGTFDERLPGGMYEPTVVAIHRRFGRHVCSAYWLIVRNRMFGLTKALFGKPIAKHDSPAGMAWSDIGPVRIGYGTKKYRATPEAHFSNGPFVEVASFTIRFK
jgi:hypothetical protein